MVRRRASSELQPLAATLRRDTALRAPQGTDGTPVAFRDWEAAVGTRIAARTRPIKLERGVLWVLAASSTWAQELTLLSAAILEQLRARGLAVRQLRFRVGQVDPPDRPPHRFEVRKAPPSAPLPPELRAELARVEDDGLREVIARAASRNLGWQELGVRDKAGLARARTRRPAPPPEPAPEPEPRIEPTPGPKPRRPAPRPVTPKRTK